MGTGSPRPAAPPPGSTSRWRPSTRRAASGARSCATRTCSRAGRRRSRASASCSTCRCSRAWRPTASPRSTSSWIPALHRNRVRWDDLDVAAPVRDLGERAWQQLQPLATAGGDTPAVHAALDAARDDFRKLYAEVEAIAQSSIGAARREGKRGARRTRAAADPARPGRAQDPQAAPQAHPRAAAPRVTMPKISVVVPIYNVEQFLDACLESIARQRVDDLEVVMVNDGSTDGGPEIAEAWTPQGRPLQARHASPTAASARRATPASSTPRASSSRSSTPTTCSTTPPTSGCSARSRRPARTSRPATCTG